MSALFVNNWSWIGERGKMPEYFFFFFINNIFQVKRYEEKTKPLDILVKKNKQFIKILSFANRQLEMQMNQRCCIAIAKIAATMQRTTVKAAAQKEVTAGRISC